MRRGHLDAWSPRCAACLAEGAAGAARLDRVVREADGHVLEGTIRCDRCGRESPIVDGVPVLLAEVRQFIRDNIDALLARRDLDPTTESLLGDAMGPGTMYDTRRSHLSSYGWGHWGDLDPEPPPALGRPAAVLDALSTGIDRIGTLPGGPIVDLGCALGRSTFALAERFGARRVLGIDASFAFLAAAALTLRTGRVDYPVRRVGVVYDRHSFEVPTPGAERVDFWVADAQALPLPPGRAALVTSLNVVDCVASPRSHIEAIRDLLCPGGFAILATPFDWSTSATPLDHWIGGHGQRGPLDGSAEQAMDMLLGRIDSPWAVGGLTVVGDPAEVEWWVRLHDRSTATYRVRVYTLRRDPAARPT